MRTKVVEIPYPDGRVQNVGGDENCELCRDDGVVPVGYSACFTDECGPCPRCQSGFEAEFGYHREWVANERCVIWHDPNRSPWGTRGYWHRHPEVAAVLEPPADSEPLPITENRRRWKALTKGLAFGEIGPPTLDAIFQNDPDGRHQAEAKLAANARMALPRPPRVQAATKASPDGGTPLPQILRETDAQHANATENEARNGDAAAWNEVDF